MVSDGNVPHKAGPGGNQHSAKGLSEIVEIVTKICSDPQKLESVT